MSLLVKSNKRGQTMVALEDGRLEYVGFKAFRLSLGETLPVNAADKELCLVLLSGRVNIEGEGFNWQNLGDRQSVFEDKSPFAAYLPPGTTAQVTALSDVQIAVCAAPGAAGYKPRLIRPEHCKRSVRGKGANTRYVCDILPDTSTVAPFCLSSSTWPAIASISSATERRARRLEYQPDTNARS